MVTLAPHAEWIDLVPRRKLADDEEPGLLARMLFRLRAEQPGLTQTMVAARAGITQSYYSDLERGVVKVPGEELVAALERAFGVEPGAIEKRLPRRSRLMLEETPPYASAGQGGAMRIRFLDNRIVIDHPLPSARRALEHIEEMVNGNEADWLRLEMTLLAWRQQRAEEEAPPSIVERLDSAERTNERR